MIEITERRMPGSVVVAGKDNEIDALLDGMIIDHPPTPRSYVNLSKVWQSIPSKEHNFIGLDICVGFLGQEKGSLIFNELMKSTNNTKRLMGGVSL